VGEVIAADSRVARREAAPRRRRSGGTGLRERGGRVVPLAESADLHAYEQTFATGSFKRKLAARDVTVSGREAYEVLYEEFAMDRSVGSRDLLAASDQWLCGLACSTYAEYYEQAQPEFAEIIAGLAITPVGRGVE
jgi:hypothetical protein